MSFTRPFLVLLVIAGLAGEARAEIPWYAEAADGTTRVQLFFFWSQRCPHCLVALPFVEALARAHPWLEVRSHELTGSRDNVALYVEMAQALGEDARAVPAFFVCGRMRTGYDGPDGMGQEVLALAELCRRMAPAQSPAGQGPAGSVSEATNPAPPPVVERDESVRLPVLGAVAPGHLSLPLLTLVVAGLDAFNPCAFFVLLFLLSLMVHARSRARMLLIGGTFVLVSGLIYFLFMAAWLNLFLVVGGAPTVTLVAGAVAVVIGLLNAKDYFFFRQGPSLAIPDGAKPSLFRRMRGLLSADNMAAMLLGTVVLALAANSYELLCTAGFPMVYTRVLTLHRLGDVAYYAYLALYNLIYVLPLLAIVGAFTATLGARKLTQRQGRVLKLLSGLMMVGLGSIMLAAPQWLDRMWVGGALLASALAITLVIYLLDRRDPAEGRRAAG